MTEKIRKIYFYGDSNTWGYDPRDIFGGRYPDEVRWDIRVAALRPDLAIVADGLNGRCVPKTESSLRELARRVQRETPDCFAVMLGTNDMLTAPRFDSKKTARELGHLLEYLRQCCGSAEKSGPESAEKHAAETDGSSAPELILIAPPQIGSADSPDPELRRFFRESRELAEECRREAAEIHAFFVNSFAWNVPLAADGVHFSEEGHREFAERIARAIPRESVLR